LTGTKHIIGMLLLASMLAAFGGAALLWQDGYRLYAVRTGSMSPTFPTGALVVATPAKDAAPAVGEVVTFRTAGGLITHRVHAVTASGLETKGDANRKPDAWTVQRERVVGLVSFGITGGGYVLVFLQQPTGVPSLVLFAMSAMFAWALFFPAQRADPLPA
jgi:signal peptidase I